MVPPTLAALLCFALTSSPPKVHTTTPSARRPFPTKTPRAATLQLSALGRSEDANARRARVMASAANNMTQATTAPPELAPFIETLANQLPSAWASLPEALRKFLPDYEPDEALAGKDMAAKAAAEEAEAAAQKVLSMRAKRMGAESVRAVETSKKEQHNNILTSYGADYGAEAPTPAREYARCYGVDAGAGAGASAGGSTRQGGPPIDEERRNRSPGLQRNFYDVPTSDFKRPHGMTGQTPPPPAALEAPPAAENYGAKPTNVPSQYGAMSPTAPAAQNGASMRFPTEAAIRRPVPPAAATTLPEPAWAVSAPSQQPAAQLNGPAVPTWEASTPKVQAAPATAPGLQSAAAANAAAATEAATAAAVTEAATAAAATEAAKAAAATEAAKAAAATEAATAAAVA